MLGQLGSNSWRAQLPAPTQNASHGPMFPQVRRHQRPDAGRTDPGHRPGEHRAQLGRLPVASGWRHPGRTSRSPGIVVARSGGNARPRSCPAPASRTSTSRVTVGSSRLGEDPTIGNNLCEGRHPVPGSIHRGWSISFNEQPFPDPCDVAKELTRQSIVNANGAAPTAAGRWPIAAVVSVFAMPTGWHQDRRGHRRQVGSGDVPQ